MTKVKGLDVVDNYESAVALQEAAIASTAVDGKVIEILEAGCGRSWPFKLDTIKYKVTGLDLDAEALRYRVAAHGDLDEVLIGDLQTVQIERGKFDVIYCSFVLEHIADAREVLLRFIEWLKPGGSIIIKVPDPQSAYGFVTRMTPHWFHVFYYRYIVGYKEAGLPGHGPYVTYYDKVVSRRGLHEFCESNDLSIELEVGMADMARYGRFKDAMLRCARRMVNIASGGVLSSRHSNLLFVLVKPAWGRSERSARSASLTPPKS